MTHKTIKIEELKLNPFTLIGRDWMLITAGNINSFNTMTASWGNLGYMWERPVASCVIRPQRFTRKFVEENEFFKLSFCGREYRSAL